MKRSDSLRRYTRDEMRQILDEASRTDPPEGTHEGDGDGFTLAEIQDIAREVGIDPGRVASAARGVVRDPGPSPRVSTGTYQMEHRFGRELDTDEMRFVAQEADRFFGVEGAVRHSAGYLEWYSPKARAFIGMVNEQGRTRVRLIVDRAPQFVGGAGLLAVLGILPSLGMFSGGGLTGVLGAAALSGATLGAVAAFWEWRRARLERQMEHLMELMKHSLPAD